MHIRRNLYVFSCSILIDSQSYWYLNYNAYVLGINLYASVDEFQCYTEVIIPMQ